VPSCADERSLRAEAQDDSPFATTPNYISILPTPRGVSDEPAEDRTSTGSVADSVWLEARRAPGEQGEEDSQAAPPTGRSEACADSESKDEEAYGDVRGVDGTEKEEMGEMLGSREEDKELRQKMSSEDEQDLEAQALAQAIKKATKEATLKALRAREEAEKGRQRAAKEEQARLEHEQKQSLAPAGATMHSHTLYDAKFGSGRYHQQAGEGQQRQRPTSGSPDLHRAPLKPWRSSSRDRDRPQSGQCTGTRGGDGSISGKGRIRENHGGDGGGGQVNNAPVTVPREDEAFRALESMLQSAGGTVPGYTRTLCCRPLLLGSASRRCRAVPVCSGMERHDAACLTVEIAKSQSLGALTS
jgi:hypothetical protein